ncbi:family 78 glycoside hydrolase catalytic domain [Nocardioides sp. NPDC126508]
MRITAIVTSTLVALSLTGAVSPAGASPGGRTEIEGLTVEHRHGEPLGVDAEKPRLGWQMSSGERGQHQTAYQILVASSPGNLSAKRGDVWDSGKVEGATAVAVRYQGAALKPATRYFWTVRAWDQDGDPTAWADPASFETGLLSTDGTTNWDGAEWISMAGNDPKTEGAPMLREETALKGRRIERARLYVSALGTYDAYVNGEPVGVRNGHSTDFELLAPGWTNYDKVVNYMSYDVTTQVAKDRRSVALAAVLGNGWYNGRIAKGSTYWAEDGNPLALKAKLAITYADGETQTLVTTPGSTWKATDTGPWRANDIYDGQTTDARKAIPGWNRTGFDDGAWADTVASTYSEKFPDAELVAYPGETAKLTPEWDRDPESITVYDEVAGEEESSNGKGHIVVDEDRSVTDPDKAAKAAVTLTDEDTAIYDLGQNMVGVPQLTVEGPEGAQVELRFGEMLNDDSGTPDDDSRGADGPEGSVYFANLRSAKATSLYTLAGGGRESHRDSQSFYGFRYVQVRVLTPGASVTIHDVTGRVATSALRETGDIETDDPLINQLFSNVRWGQRGNYLWIPTDCPQRDERQGWTGDTQLFSNTALYNGDSTNFLSHFQDSTIDSQELYGLDGAQYTATVPGGAFAIPAPMSGWSDTGVVVPWTVWQMSGDTTIIDDSWPSMTKYLDWIQQKTGTTYAGQGAIFGDWLAFQPTANQLASDVYYAYAAKLMADMAEATGRSEEAADYRELFGNIKDAFVAKYLQVDEDGRTYVKGIGDSRDIDGTRPAEDNTQTGLTWALKLGLFDTDAQHQDLLDALVANVGNSEAYKQDHPDSTRVDYEENTLSTGFLGVNVLAPQLSAEGRSDLAYELLHQDAMPSWLYSVKNGATTIWERWNSYSTEDGFGPVEMNSFNHYSYGAIVEWMYERMAGIAKDPEAPGFKHFLLQPTLDPTGGITEVEGSFDSPYGTIESAWELDGDTFSYEATVPANTTATLRVPAASADAVTEHGRPLAEAEGVTLTGVEDGVATFEVGSGTYEIESRVP